MVSNPARSCVFLSLLIAASSVTKPQNSWQPIKKTGQAHSVVFCAVQSLSPRKEANAGLLLAMIPGSVEAKVHESKLHYSMNQQHHLL